MNKFLALTALSLVLTACGDKSGDPLKGYEEFSNRIPVGAAKSVKKQNHAICGSVVTSEKLVVVEGQSGSNTVKVCGVNAGMVSSYTFVEAVSGASLVKGKQSKSTTEACYGKNAPAIYAGKPVIEQEYKLSYKAKRGTVSYIESSKLISTSVAPQSQIKSKVICSSPVQIEVQKIKGIPAITSIDGETTLKYEDIKDVELTINVQAAEVTKVEDLKLTVGFDQSRQSQENNIINIKSLKPEISGTIAVASTSYQYKIKISGEALKAAVDKESATLTKQKKNRMFVDFHATFLVSNSHTKEKSLTNDYILRIDRKPIEEAATPAPAQTVSTTGAKK